MSVRSGVSSEKLQRELLFPDDYQLLEGSPQAWYSIVRGQPLVRKYRIFLPENARQAIVANAQIGQPGQAFFAASAELAVQQESQAGLKARAISPRPYKQTERNGVKLREYILGK